jgi:pyrroline-5-carboxylate reductase
MKYGDTTIAFVGGGNMARALVAGLLQAGHAPEKLRVADPDPGQRARLHKLSPHLIKGDDNATACEEADVVVLAVKPQLLSDVARALDVKADQLVLSVAAGVPLDALGNWLGADVPCVRVMPNQPALVGAGMSVLCASAGVNEAQRELATYVLDAGGETAWIEDEQLMDAVTAVSGSGPAYFYLVMELLEEEAVRMGLAPDIARLLAVQTAYGAGAAALESGIAPAELRRMVTSPGGTTQAALESLEQGGIHALFEKALAAARQRSEELGRVDED